MRLNAWSMKVEGDVDAMCCVMNIAKPFKCEDAFISHLIHDPESGNSRMEVLYDNRSKTHYLWITMLPEESSSISVGNSKALGSYIRFDLYDA